MKEKIYEILRNYVAKRATHNLGKIEIKDKEVICYVDGKKLKKQMKERNLDRYNIMLHCIPRDEEIYKVYKLDKPVHYIIRNIDFDKEIEIMASMKDCHVTFEKCKFTACVGVSFADHLTFIDNIYRAQTYKNYFSIHKHGEFCISTRTNKNKINKIEFFLDKINLEDTETIPIYRARDLNNPIINKTIKTITKIWLYAKEIVFSFSDISNAKSIDIEADTLKLICSDISSKEAEIKANDLKLTDTQIKSDVITIDSPKIDGKLLMKHNGLFINGVEIDKTKNEVVVDNYDISLQQNRLDLINSLKKIEAHAEEKISEEIKRQPLTRILKK